MTSLHTHGLKVAIWMSSSSPQHLPCCHILSLPLHLTLSPGPPPCSCTATHLQPLLPPEAHSSPKPGIGTAPHSRPQSHRAASHGSENKTRVLSVLSLILHFTWAAVTGFLVLLKKQTGFQPQGLLPYSFLNAGFVSQRSFLSPLPFSARFLQMSNRLYPQSLSVRPC